MSSGWVELSTLISLLTAVARLQRYQCRAETVFNGSDAWAPSVAASDIAVKTAALIAYDRSINDHQ